MVVGCSLPRDQQSPGSEMRETAIQEAIARTAILAVDVLEKSLDDALRVIDDIGLTTKAPLMASFAYWRNLVAKRYARNAGCPFRSGRKVKHCLHRHRKAAQIPSTAGV